MCKIKMQMLKIKLFTFNDLGMIRVILLNIKQQLFNGHVFLNMQHYSQLSDKNSTNTEFIFRQK